MAFVFLSFFFFFTFFSFTLFCLHPKVKSKNVKYAKNYIVNKRNCVKIKINFYNKLNEIKKC